MLACRGNGFRRGIDSRDGVAIGGELLGQKTAAASDTQLAPALTQAGVPARAAGWPRHISERINTSAVRCITPISTNIGV